MGGYSTALYLGLAVGSFAAGPMITRHGYPAGFAIGGAAGVMGALIAGGLWARDGAPLRAMRLRLRRRGTRNAPGR